MPFLCTVRPVFLIQPGHHCRLTLDVARAITDLHFMLLFSTMQNAKGDSPLHDAVRGDWPEVVELLLQAGASVENLAEGGFNAAQLATYLGYKK